ncbi:MAG: hypothetical protein OIF38_14775, partial [Cellvibrionaceae bacterium]|nr:hypothetical protein [Cellvibrionaceae bacterium]
GLIEFAGETKVDPITIVNMVQKQPQFYKLSGANQLRFSLDLENAQTRIQAVDELLDNLTPR